MILATKSGWLISCVLVAETETHYTIKARDRKSNRKVSKNSKTEKLFDCVYKAETWIKENN